MKKKKERRIYRPRFVGGKVMIFDCALVNVFGP
jgi:hypothetical protein